MQSNSLIAFKNIIDNKTATVNPARISSNRINNVGDALEYFVQDAYSGLLGEGISDSVRDQRYAEVFSWLGNSSNPPDSLVRGGEGIEVKKIESLSSDIALNSSFPKSKLLASDTRVANGAKTAESWTSRDIVYAIGSVPNQELKRLWLIYGDCYAASKDVYQRLIDVITDGIQTIQDVEFHETNELAKVKKVDPLGITDMRIRGMWHIQNPSRLYDHLVTTSSTRQYYLLMRAEKYDSFPEQDRLSLEISDLDGYSNEIIEIRNPDNPAQLIQARFIKYEF